MGCKPRLASKKPNRRALVLWFQRSGVGAQLGTLQRPVNKMVTLERYSRHSNAFAEIARLAHPNLRAIITPTNGLKFF